MAKLKFLMRWNNFVRQVADKRYTLCYSRHMFDTSDCSIVGMVHTLPLPGSPKWAGNIHAVIARAVSDAEALVQGGCTSILIENMGDLPYLNGSVYPETLVALTRVVDALQHISVPKGLQILAGANTQALALATIGDLDFIRVEGFAYGHVADEGWMDACAGPLLRQRATLSSVVQIWADVQKKHAAHALTSDLTLGELAHGAVFCGADVCIITGRKTGDETSASHVRAAKDAGRPVAVGSGVTPENAGELAQIADALIVGSWFKVDGDWRNPVDKARVQTLIRATKSS